MQSVILCGGLGTRLQPITKKKPKSMVEIEGKPFLEYQLKLLKKNNLFDVILCTGYKSKEIEKYFGNGKKFGIKINYSKDNNELLGTGGALKKVKDLLDKSFLVMYGDSYLPFNFNLAISRFNKLNTLGLMVVYKNKNKYEKSNVLLGKNLIKEYNKEKSSKKMQHIDYGVSIFKKEILKNFPKDKTFDLSKIHKKLIKKAELSYFETKTRFYQIGDFKGLKEFKKYIKNNNI